MTWETVPLGEVARVDAVQVAPGSVEAGSTYVGLEHISAGGVIDETFLAADAGLKSSKNRFTSRHILYGKLRPNLGKVARPRTVGVCSTDIYPLLPGPEVDRDYLAQYFLSPQAIGYASSRTAGVNLPRVSWSALGSLPIPLPPLTEQRRIAAILDEADALRQRRARAIQLSRLLIDRVAAGLAREAPSRTVPLSQIATVSSGITKGRPAPRDDVRLVPYMTVANVQDKALNLDPVKTIEASESEIDRYRLRAGDLLLTEGGDPDKLGRGVVWDQQIPEAIHQNHVFRVRPEKPLVDPTWLNWEVGSEYGKRYFLRAAKQTTGIATINSTQLRAFPVRLVSMESQRVFVDTIATLQRAMKRRHEHLESIDELFASLQHRAFRGEL